MQYQAKLIYNGRVYVGMGKTDHDAIMQARAKDTIKDAPAERVTVLVSHIYVSNPQLIYCTMLNKYLMDIK